jgi:hypothetical protein
MARETRAATGNSKPRVSSSHISHIVFTSRLTDFNRSSQLLRKRPRPRRLPSQRPRPTRPRSAHLRPREASPPVSPRRRHQSRRPRRPPLVMLSRELPRRSKVPLPRTQPRRSVHDCLLILSAENSDCFGSSTRAVQARFWPRDSGRSPLMYSPEPKLIFKSPGRWYQEDQGRDRQEGRCQEVNHASQKAGCLVSLWTPSEGVRVLLCRCGLWYDAEGLDGYALGGFCYTDVTGPGRVSLITFLLYGMVLLCVWVGSWHGLCCLNGISSVFISPANEFQCYGYILIHIPPEL